MFYPKNVPNWERGLRVIGGITLVAVALIGQMQSNGQAIFVTAALLISAFVAVVTGFVGWCPMCALVGRKLKSKSTANEIRP
jgi:hypothetical protein